MPLYLCPDNRTTCAEAVNNAPDREPTPRRGESCVPVYSARKPLKRRPALRSTQLQTDRLIPALASRRYEPAQPAGRPAGRHTAITNAILPREAERARRAVAEHLEGTAALLRGFLT